MAFMPCDAVDESCSIRVKYLICRQERRSRWCSKVRLRTKGHGSFLVALMLWGGTETMCLLGDVQVCCLLNLLQGMSFTILQKKQGSQYIRCSVWRIKACRHDRSKYIMHAGFKALLGGLLAGLGGMVVDKVVVGGIDDLTVNLRKGNTKQKKKKCKKQ